MDDSGTTEQVLNRMIVGSWVTQAIYVAAELGIADVLAAGPRTADELARETGMHGASLYRVLRALASVDIFREDGEGRFPHPRRARAEHGKADHHGPRPASAGRHHGGHGLASEEEQGGEGRGAGRGEHPVLEHGQGPTEPRETGSRPGSRFEHFALRPGAPGREGEVGPAVRRIHEQARHGQGPAGKGSVVDRQVHVRAVL